MGDRAIVRFPATYGTGSGVEVYLHWNGSDALDWLKQAAPRMRKGDASYAAARFIGFCHDQIEGGLSLGVFPINTCCDGVIYSVDCNTGKVKRGARQVATLPMGQF